MKKNILGKFKRYILTCIGAAFTGFAVSLLLTPNKIVCGGLAGISTILYQTLHIAPGITYAITNAVLLILGIKFLGKSFTIKTLFGAGMNTLFVQLFSYLPPITDNVFLATVFGGIIQGLGIGIAFVAEASTGGIDILGRIIQYFLPQFPIGKLLLIVNSLILITSLVVFKDAELVLFGILSLFFSSYCVDWLIRKMNVSKIAFVITEKGEEISNFLISTSLRGVTIIKVIGAYSLEHKKMLFCALKENEIQSFQIKILNIDKDAFIVYSESQQIMGNGFHIYR